MDIFEANVGPRLRVLRSVGQHLPIAQAPEKGLRGSTPDPRTPTGTLESRDATAHNLRDVDIDIPLEVLALLVPLLNPH